MIDPQDELIRYAQLDGTEWGEAMELLIQLSERLDYVSDELSAMIQKEINDSLAYVKANAEIIETEETFTRKYSDLVWK